MQSASQNATKSGKLTAILKSFKLLYLCNHLLLRYRDEILHFDVMCQSAHYCLNFCKIPDGGRRTAAILKKLNCDISATVYAIMIKFYTTLHPTKS